MAGQVWAVADQGGFMYSDELSDYLRQAVQPAVRFRQFCDAQDATEAGTGKAYGTGERFTWNVYSDVQEGGEALNENAEMPETNFRVSQGSLTITEYGNSVPYTGKLDNLSKHPVMAVINRVLRNDVAKTIDGAAYGQFRLTNLKVNAVSGTSVTDVVVVETGSIGVTNNIELRFAHIKAIGDALKERNIPAYQENDYFAIGWPRTFRTVKNDLEVLHSYVDQGFRMIMNGEIGRAEGVRFIEQTYVAKGGAEDSVTYNFRVADPWNNARSDWAFFFGEDTVAEAVVIPEEMRGKIPGDYGRDKGIAWYYLGGFGIVHAGAGNKNARIMYWQSAA